MRAEAFRWFVRGAGLAFGAALAVAVVYMMLIGARVLVLVFIALLLASGLEPLIDRIRAYTRLGRGAALLLVYAVFFVLMISLVLLVVPGAINQFNDLGTRLSPLLSDAREWARTIEPRALSTSLVGLINTIQRALTPSSTPAPDADDLIALGLTFAEVVVSVISVIVLVYFWLTGRAHLQRFALALVPADRRGGAREAWNEIELRLGSWVRGQLILMGTIGVATSVAYFLIGLEGALLLGLIAAAAELIPLVGPALGAVPALLVAAMTGNMETVILVAVVYFVIQVIEGNVLVPVIMHNTIGVPPFIVFASILAGAAVAGIPGALISVPFAAALLVIIERLQARDQPIPISNEQPSSEVAEPAES
ncbi:AI-2E family transporter [soil metagenome]